MYACPMAKLKQATSETIPFACHTALGLYRLSTPGMLKAIRFGNAAQHTDKLLHEALTVEHMAPVAPSEY